MKPNLTEIKTNVFHIPERLKEIDAGYFVVRNHEKRRFEVHHRFQPHTTYCLTVPYGELDERTVVLVRKTAWQNAEKLIAEMEEHNRKLQKQNTLADVESVQKTKEVLSYLNQHESKEWVDKDAFSTRFV